MVRALVLAALLFVGSAAVVEAAPVLTPTAVLAQSAPDDGSSSSRRTRIPRGTVKLGIWVVVGAIAGIGAIIKKMRS
jgi:hypothetical protein